MPLYSYTCEKCEAEFEKILTMHAKYNLKTVVPCPECGSEETRSVISRRTNFSLKGGGWYKDGYSSGTGNSD